MELRVLLSKKESLSDRSNLKRRHKQLSRKPWVDVCHGWEHLKVQNNGSWCPGITYRCCFSLEKVCDRCLMFFGWCSST